MGETLPEDLRGRVPVAPEGAAWRSTVATCSVRAAATAVRWSRMRRETGTDPVILIRAARGPTSRWSRWLAGVRRVVPSTIGRFVKRHGMSVNRTPHASERQAGRRGPPEDAVRYASGPGSPAAHVRRGDRRYEHNVPATRPRRARRVMPGARPYTFYPIKAMLEFCCYASKAACPRAGGNAGSSLNDTYARRKASRRNVCCARRAEGSHSGGDQSPLTVRDRVPTQLCARIEL
jgi:hypothetical protein